MVAKISDPVSNHRQGVEYTGTKLSMLQVPQNGGFTMINQKHFLQILLSHLRTCNLISNQLSTLKENKLVIPLVAASEKGTGRAESPFEKKVEMWWNIRVKSMSRSFLERNTLEGDSPVDEIDISGSKRVGRLGLVV